MITIRWINKIPLETKAKNFYQALADRIMTGHFRYGAPKKEKLYLSKLKKELKAYDKSGNKEHLFNVANYCFLEYLCPEHSKAHINVLINSVTKTIEKEYRHK